jgi:hypothetical protein
MNTEAVNASPTKSFFVNMLTRDIELADAILDLLDNCIDGILRLQKDTEPTDPSKPYKSYWAKITANPEEFIISDNCGGIPKDVAINSAFMLGRIDPERDSDLETVGMYGIGMKRAIFKMGEQCTVVSQHGDEDPYKVTISPKWLKEEGNWTLPLEPTDRTGKKGTTISITKLRKGIKSHFQKNKSSFLNDLQNDIAKLFAIIIGKGFRIDLNGDTIKPINLSLMTPDKVGKKSKPRIEPYVFVGEYYNVNIELVVGFYRPLPTEAEVDDELTRKRTRSNAGWTVICNDRIVLHNDTSMKTGWGTSGVPNYHNQFIAIAGVLSFHSNESMNLPLNTTKRGLDTSSDVYLIALDHMREGMKKFISYTNAWKKREEETETQFHDLELAPAIEISKRVVSTGFTEVRRHKSAGSGKYYSPALPKPDDKVTTKRISFSAEEADIKILAEYYYEDESTHRNVVGQRCFEECLHEAVEAGR